MRYDDIEMLLSETANTMLFQYKNKIIIIIIAQVC